MLSHRTTRKIGNLAWVFGLACLALTPSLSQAATQLTAQVDRDRISQDESVSLKMTLSSDGTTSLPEPEFNAPDFEVVNQYVATFVESYYENGHFGVKNNQQITKVLRPLKTGDLRISKIHVEANGKIYSATDLVVHVGPPGSGTPPPPGYGGSGVGLRGNAKHVSGIPVKVRAEVNKDRAYKGEQIIVSYYLYRRVKVFNIQVDKFPILNGFLREDMEMPVLGQQLDSERVMLDGVPYERSLLARYAAYPLQEGRLKIDSMALKYSYFGGTNYDESDPFASLFQQMAPRVGTGSSEQVPIEVVPLPEAGKPASFSGGVGDFTVASAVDKYDVRANEAVNLTVKIEGRGNAAAITEPKTKWPDNVELYDSKGQSKTGKGGVGEKDFEFLLIPRAPGKLTLPAFEFSYFDPLKKEYVTRTTEPIQINVLEPAPGTSVVGSTRGTAPVQSVGPGAPNASAPAPMTLRPLLPPGALSSGMPFLKIWRLLGRIALAGFAVFFLWVGIASVGRQFRQRRLAAKSQALSQSKSWDRLRVAAKEAAKGAAWQNVIQTYELLTGAMFDALDRLYSVGARSLPRQELCQILAEEHQVPDALWNRVSRLLEYAETVRFASSAGGVSETAARSELTKWVDEAETVVKELERSR